MKRDKFLSLPAAERREFLKILGTILAAPHVPGFFRLAANEMLFKDANAAEGLGAPTFFIEVNLRDQWQTNHTFVPPGLAKNLSIPRGLAASNFALFQDPQTLIDAGNGFFLTKESALLQKHLSNIAVVETCELPIGNVHGHEAANATRSPGRIKGQTVGKLSMKSVNYAGFQNDGNEDMYSNTPTPAALHGHYAKLIDPNYRRNAVAYKGVGRPIHTVFHFPGALKNANVDEYQSVNALLNAFASASTTPGASPVVQLRNKHGAMISDFLKRLDTRFMERYGHLDDPKVKHLANVTSAGENLAAQNVPPPAPPTPFSLPLTAAEREKWSAGVPNESDEFDPNRHVRIWEQFAYASKLITSGVARTFAIEHDIIDVHGSFNPTTVQTMGAQLAICLERLISDIKAAGIWDRTLIAVYTLDGGRAPSVESYGDLAKNSVILAGGKVKGGYFGDVRYANNEWFYHRPDFTTGNPITDGTAGKDKRVSGAEIWNTTLALAGIPASLRTYPDVDPTRLLQFLMRS